MAVASMLPMAAGAALLTRFASGDILSATPKMISAGEYSVGNLPGWQRSVLLHAEKKYIITTRGRKRTVWIPGEKHLTFSKSLDGSTANIDLTILTFRETLQSNDVMAGFAGAEKAVNLVGRVSGTATGDSVLWVKKTRFDGKEAFLRSLQYQYQPKGTTGIPVEVVNITFWGGKNIYIISRSLRGASIPSSLRQKTQQGWIDLLQAIQNQSRA